MIKLTNKTHIEFGFSFSIWCILFTIAYHKDDYWDEKNIYNSYIMFFYSFCI